jgi:hypothetical protein
MIVVKLFKMRGKGSFFWEKTKGGAKKKREIRWFMPQVPRKVTPDARNCGIFSRFQFFGKSQENY